MRRRAVIVDDDPITRMDLADVLQRAGFEIAEQGADGFDAVESCRRHRPDIVILDVKMPVFNGLDAARGIIEEGTAGGVLLLTAYSDAEFVQKAAAFGVSGYLVKPADERMLLPMVEVALAQAGRLRKARAEAEQWRRKFEDKNLVDRAKAMLAAEDGTSEGDAYAKLQKMAMNKRLSVADMAAKLVEMKSGRPLVDRAKQLLMERHGLSEKAAYKRLKAYAEERGLPLPVAAGELAAKLDGE